MANSIEMTALCRTVEEAIKSASNKSELSAPVTATSRMGEPREWDSLSFVVVFNAVAEAYDVMLEDDDAIHFTSIGAMHEFLIGLADAA